MASAKAYTDEMIRRLVVAGIKLREPPQTPIGFATCPVTDIDPGLETRLHAKIHMALRDCIERGLMELRPTLPLTGIVFFPRLLPDRDRAGPFGKEILIHKRDGSVFVGLHICLRAWRAADIAGKVDLLRENIVNSIARIRPKRLFDADRARLLGWSMPPSSRRCRRFGALSRTCRDVAAVSPWSAARGRSAGTP